MYTLRKISKKGLQTNEIIGDKYSLITEGGLSQEEFNNKLEIYNSETPLHIDCRVFGFITTEKNNVIPLYVDERIYVMTSNGDTFSKLQ